MDKEERKQLRIRLRRLPLEQLIEKPNCNFECPGEKFICCVEEGCGHGHFTKNEKQERGFTEEDIILIDSLFDKDAGFLTPTGCNLPRKLRSINCLRHVCNAWRKE